MSCGVETIFLVNLLLEVIDLLVGVVTWGLELVASGAFDPGIVSEQAVWYDFNGNELLFRQGDVPVVMLALYDRGRRHRVGLTGSRPCRNPQSGNEAW